jgi:hypothetical protein
MDKGRQNFGFAFVQDRRLRADVLFIRTQSAIRADGTPSAQAQSRLFESPHQIRRGELKRSSFRF